MKKIISKVLKVDQKGKLDFLLKPLKKVYFNLIQLKLYFNIKIEKIRGLDFTERVSVEELGLSAEDSKSYVASSSSKVKFVLKSLEIKNTDAVLDYGSGKGKMLHVMSKFPFKHVDGVEISKHLCDIANKNLTKLKVNKTTIYNSEASAFKDLDTYNFFYFFNPFPAKIMEKVMTNIQVSHEKHSREITIIYYVPLFSEEITKSGLFKKTESFWDLNVYKNELKPI